MVYITQTGQRYHYAHCRTIVGTQINTVTREQAQSMGLTPCRVCMPEQQETIEAFSITEQIRAEQSGGSFIHGTWRSSETWQYRLNSYIRQEQRIRENNGWDRTVWQSGRMVGGVWQDGRNVRVQVPTSDEWQRQTGEPLPPLPVFITSTGTSYHRSNCGAIAEQQEVSAIDITTARNGGRTACQVCRP